MCERGNICNFIHCFRNPRDEYQGVTPGEVTDSKRPYSDEEDTATSASVSRPDERPSVSHKDERPAKRIKKEAGDCKYYMLTGACRDGRKCSKDHFRSEATSTVMIKNFFQHEYLDQYDVDRVKDDGEEKRYDNMDMMRAYGKFYEVVLAKFRAIGPVTMFKCCRNFARHLRGNVYVEFSEEKYAQDVSGTSSFANSISLESLKVVSRHKIDGDLT